MVQDFVHPQYEQSLVDEIPGAGLNIGQVLRMFTTSMPMVAPVGCAV